jgi:hypothetical protein
MKEKTENQLAWQQKQSEKLKKNLEIFLNIYAELGNISQACKAANICRASYHHCMKKESYIVTWRGEEVEFTQAVKDAYEEAIDGMEAEALRRATVGTQELVLHQGKPVMVDQLDDKGKPTGERVALTRTKVSDLLLIFLLKGARPKKYADHRTVEQTGSIEHVHRDIRDLTPEQQHGRMNEYVRNYQRMLGIGQN